MDIPRQQQPLPVVHNAYTPKEAIEISSRTGAYKAKMRIDKTIISSFMAGCLLSFSGACYAVINTSPWLNENAPGIARMLGASIFPFGLIVIVMTGADLCTGSFMYTSLSALHRRTSVLLMLRHWLLTFFGNLAGALFVTCVIMGYGGVFSAAAYRKELLAIATTKAVTPEWHQIFVKAIGANWLVCLACFLACCAREFFSKAVAIWGPVFAFVLLGLDHVVANMFYIPMAIFLHHPDISVSFYIWKSMIPAALGNIVGGSVFVAFVYWYLFLVGDTSEIVIDGDYWDVESRSSMTSISEQVTNQSHSNKDDGKMV
ncbi:formate/nitrate family transporter [Aureobasidium sp. EXF-10727]|nr:formate/nitrate family transporter [Aureobasidium sp. EXF-10727]